MSLPRRPKLGKRGREARDGALSPRPTGSLERSRNQATIQGFRRFRTVIATGKTVEPSSAQSSVDVVATPHCDRPDTIRERTAEECGRCAACAAAISAKPKPAVRRPCALRKIRSPIPSAFSRAFWRAKALTMPAPQAYISPLGAPPLRDGVSREAPHCLRGDHPASPWPRRMCGLRWLVPRFSPQSGSGVRERREKTGPEGFGLFDKCIGRKRNVDGGVPADRVLERRRLRLSS